MGALFVGTASADIPAPDAFSEVAMCIRDNTPMMPSGRPSGRPSAAPDILKVDENPMVADLFEPMTVGH